MLDYLSQVYVLLASKLFLAVYVQGCDEGWFGASCNYMCHCEQSKSCDVKGHCPNSDRCKVGFFGPGCQYVDLVSSDALASVEAYLKDSNDTTCNPDPNATSVEISLNISYPFSWFRIHASRSGNLLKFTTELNNGEACTIERKFLVSDTVVDVTCDRKISVNKLRITGAIAASVCSVYISGGRNVALKQQSNQTSNLDLKSPASNAVDGYTDGNSSRGHCSSTALETELPVWHLSYSRPAILYKVRVYNRNEFQERLKNFLLTTFSYNATVVTSKSDSSSVPWAVNDIDVYSDAPITSLRISQSQSQPTSEWILTLCEVETFGDIVCPEYTYGLNCEVACTCSKSDVCSPVTGVCAPGCQPGFYGYGCLANCSAECLNGTCQYYSGSCDHCIPGYFGTDCMDACLPGTFGSDCLLTCSEHCSTPCHHINGNCSCKDGYSGLHCTECTQEFCGENKTCSPLCQVCDGRSGNCTVCVKKFAGPYCNDCKDGFFGESCTSTCSAVCKVCEKHSGYCVECLGYRTGRLCRDCQRKHFGADCDQKCSSGCLNRTCDQSSGHCFECAYGYQGDTCEHEGSPSWFLYLLLVAPVSLLVLLLYTRRPDSAAEASRPTVQSPEEILQLTHYRTTSSRSLYDVALHAVHSKRLLSIHQGKLVQKSVSHNYHRGVGLELRGLSITDSNTGGQLCFSATKHLQITDAENNHRSIHITSKGKVEF